MKILWVSEVHPDPNSGAGGTELLMVQQLRNLGHTVETIWADDLPRRIAHGNLHYALELPGTYAKAITAACRRTRFDIVTVNLGQSYLAGRRLKAQGFEGAFIVRSHGLDDHLDETLAGWQRHMDLPNRAIWKRLFGRILTAVTHGHLSKAAKVCDGYIVSNSLDAEYLRSRHGLNSDRIACIPQAPAAAFLQQPMKPMCLTRLNRLLYVAGFHFAKGPHAAAVAANELLRRHSLLSLTWICHPNDHDKVRALLDSKFASRIRLLGWMSQNDLVREFDQHGMLIYPSLFDGFGKVFLEAMSRGLCVIGTRAGGMIDIIRHGENGFFCEFNNPEQIVEQVSQLSESLELASRISTNAAATAAEYTWERVGSELSLFFRKRWTAKQDDVLHQPGTAN